MVSGVTWVRLGSLGLLDDGHHTGGGRDGVGVGHGVFSDILTGESIWFDVQRAGVVGNDEGETTKE